MLFSNSLLLLYTTLGVLTAEIFKVNIVTIGLIIGFIIQSFHSFDVPLYDVGILITMLIIGTHLEWKTMKRYKLLTSLILISTGLLIGIVYFMVDSLLHLSKINSLIISTSLCLSSTLICHQKLEQDKATNTNYGKITIISTIVQDLIGIILLASLHLNAKAINTIGLQSIGLIVLIVLVNFSKKYIKHIVDYIQSSSTTQGIYNVRATLTLLILTLGHMTSIPQEFLYFVSGLMLKDIVLESKYEVQYLQTITMILLFIFAGHNMDIQLIIDNISKILELFVLTTILKIFVLYGFIILESKRFDATIRSAILLSTCSELSFFIISVINIDKNTTNIIFATTMLSMIFNPSLFNMVSRALDQIQQKSTGIAKYAARMHIGQLSGKYVLVIGINEVTRMLIYELGNSLVDIVAIDNRLDTVLDNPKNCYFMDALSDETYKIIEPAKLYCVVIIAYRLQTQLDIISKIQYMSASLPIYVVTSKKDVNNIIDHVSNIIPIISNTNPSNTVELILENIKDHINN